MALAKVFPPPHKKGTSMKSKDKNQTFEVRMQRLQDIVSSMERGEIPLDESVALYKEGIQLSKDCRAQLEKARHEIRLLTEDGAEDFILKEEEI